MSLRRQFWELYSPTICRKSWAAINNDRNKSMVRSLCVTFLLLRLVLCFTFSCSGLNATAQAPDTAAITAAMKPLLENFKGDVAISLYHFESDTHWNHRGTDPMPTASLIKLPVMIEAYRQAASGRVDMEQQIVLQEADKVPGSGILTSHFSAGTKLSLRDAIRLMMVYSDNTATNLVVDAIGLPSTAAYMKELGYPDTQLHAKVFRRDTSIALERSQKFGLGSTTANDMVGLLTRLKRGELADESSTASMIDHMLHCDDKTRFPLLLPTKVKVAHKTGSVNRVRTDAGLLMDSDCTLALCVLTDNIDDTRWTDDNAGNQLCAEVAKVAYQLFTTRKSASEPADSLLQLGATGDLVETLQRTLNARSQPSPNLGVDGDFGPATQAAVKAFQKQSNIATTGVVDAATWKALGDLVERDVPLGSPAEINAEKLAIEPMDDPHGPPQVTCKAWSILDRDHGNSVGSHNGDEPLNIASTTKIMTAYIVLKLAATDPSVLEEVVTFSQRADNTNGSTAGVRAGEQLPVSELLYGLLLPSGNDAAVAFAEHFGKRFAEPGTTNEQAYYDAFVAHMNATAKELGLTKTHYKNPHGLTAAGHLSTANELARLTRAALEIPRFRDYVTTRLHAYSVTGATGYKRTVKWENTNRLLKIEGYGGVKTGTTDAAGPCLVSCSQRDGRELIVVVLNAANPDARYMDSRNLHAFGWRQIHSGTSASPK
jgi:serine-type D-Ala-D-Ala carboxypeptidase (penicillin-binding protein 5/6)